MEVYTIRWFSIPSSVKVNGKLKRMTGFDEEHIKTIVA